MKAWAARAELQRQRFAPRPEQKQHRARENGGPRADEAGAGDEREDAEDFGDEDEQSGGADGGPEEGFAGAVAAEPGDAPESEKDGYGKKDCQRFALLVGWNTITVT